MTEYTFDDIEYAFSHIGENRKILVKNTGSPDEVVELENDMWHQMEVYSEGVNMFRVVQLSNEVELSYVLTHRFTSSEMDFGMTGDFPVRFIIGTEDVRDTFSKEQLESQEFNLREDPIGPSFFIMFTSDDIMHVGVGPTVYP